MSPPQTLHVFVVSWVQGSPIPLNTSCRRCHKLMQVESSLSIGPTSTCTLCARSAAPPPRVPAVPRTSRGCPHQAAHRPQPPLANEYEAVLAVLASQHQSVLS
ncbi:hypothetical protein B0H17DRAFT_1148459 [Mycena rosella]|uniref:Uncharacterized protein n=1 Tax=Mycena rosella TaxID=1033263 RepID=A0AAD7CDF9_MYCRO|nr:hypothetical protein B0H17DRAFT_1148459 [Mycena rosella]